jgi:hypothetical protein
MRKVELLIVAFVFGVTTTAGRADQQSEIEAQCKFSETLISARKCSLLSARSLAKEVGDTAKTVAETAFDRCGNEWSKLWNGETGFAGVGSLAEALRTNEADNRSRFKREQVEALTPIVVEYRTPVPDPKTETKDDLPKALISYVMLMAVMMPPVCKATPEMSKEYWLKFLLSVTPK